MRFRQELLISVKHLLTRIGAHLPHHALVQIQAAVNYLRVGRAMQDDGYTPLAGRVSSREDVWQAILARVRDKRVLYLEFGVAFGESIRFWSRELVHAESVLHGFDSFEGLPEDAGPWKKGQFGAGGSVPAIADARVAFFKGWFDQTLPSYSLANHDVLVINLDADLYSSTAFVLRHLRDHIKCGSFIYFDEMNHVEHEYRAFKEFRLESGLRFRLLAADRTLAFVAFECTGAEHVADNVRRQ